MMKLQFEGKIFNSVEEYNNYISDKYDNIDYEWANKKFNLENHGAVYTYNNKYSRLYIDSIYGKNKLQIFWYNIILLFRYLRRKNDKNK